MQDRYLYSVSGLFAPPSGFKTCSFEAVYRKYIVLRVLRKTVVTLAAAASQNVVEMCAITSFWNLGTIWRSWV